MPYLNDDDKAWAKVQQGISAALEPFAAALGPRVCSHGPWVDCEDCSFEDTQPSPGSVPMIKTWVLVATIEDITDEAIISSITAHGQRNHETKGLLHVALFE